jgi:hypothetical protein
MSEKFPLHFYIPKNMPTPGVPCSTSIGMTAVSTVRELLFTDWSPALVRAHARAGARRLAAWWLAEFRDLLPRAVALRLCDRGQPVIRLQACPDVVRIDVVSPAGRVMHSADIARADYSAAALDRHLVALGRERHGAILALVLPESAIFTRTFGIPTRARERLPTIARQELEHRTPFLAADVHLGMVVAAQRDGHTIMVHQSIVRRDLVEAAARALDLDPAEIAFVTAATPQGAPPAAAIRLRPDSDRKAAKTRRLAAALTAAAALLSCADAALFWWTQERTIATIEARAAGERDKAMAVRSLEEEIARVQLALRTLAERRGRPSVTDLWRETSRVLPDNTWLSDWRRRNGSVSIAGLSAAATALVALFEKSPLFGEASLDAPITVDTVSGRERFSLILRTPVSPRLAQR